MRSFRTVGFALAAIVSLAGCRREAREAGIAFAFSWGDKPYHAWLQSQLDRRRPEGAVRIRLITKDSGSAYSAATQLSAEVLRARLFIEDPAVSVVVGPGGSREVLQVAPMYRDAGLAVIVPSATSRRLAEAGEWTFTLAPNDSLQGEFIAAYADTALHAKSIVIYYTPDEYGSGLMRGTVAALGGRDVKVVDQVPLRAWTDCLEPNGRQHFADVADLLARQGGADVAIIAARSGDCACLTYALKARMPELKILLGDAAELNAWFMRRSGKAGNGVLAVAHWHPDLPGAQSREFAADFRAAGLHQVRHGDAVFYDGMMLAASAIWAVGDDRAAIREYLGSIGTSRPAYEGVAGPVSFAPGFRRPLYITRMQDSIPHLVTGKP